tara:strand:+ start:4666 stop:6003 length:1338 start_codon:yes stop_codon:yes gene_type:complete
VNQLEAGKLQLAGEELAERRASNALVAQERKDKVAAKAVETSKASVEKLVTALENAFALPNAGQIPTAATASILRATNTAIEGLPAKERAAFTARIQSIQATAAARPTAGQAKLTEARDILGRDLSEQERLAAAGLGAKVKPEEEGGAIFAGKGLPASVFNFLTDVGQKFRLNELITGEQATAYSLAVADFEAVKQSQDPSTGAIINVRRRLPSGVFPRPAEVFARAGIGQSAQPGAATVVPSAPSAAPTAATAEPPATSAPLGEAPVEREITGGKKRLSPEQAGRQAMIQLGRENIRKIRDFVLPGGQLSRANIALMNVPLIGEPVILTEGRTQRARLEDTLQAKLRLETGAAAPEPEKIDLLDRFLPNVFDEKAGVIDKMNRLERFFDISLSESNPALFQKLTARTAKELGISTQDLLDTAEQEGIPIGEAADRIRALKKKGG